MKQFSVFCLLMVITFMCNAQTVYTYTDFSGTFDDGSGSANYDVNLNNLYIIKPTGASKVDLEFISFDVEEIYDSVCIYDGESTNATLIGVYNNEAPPTSVFHSSGNSLCIKFTSDEIETYGGWTVYYCGVVSTTYTDQTGTFDDGSGSSDYANNAKYSYLISPQDAVWVDIAFPNFDTEAGNDLVYVYDGTDETANLIGTYDNSNPPPPLIRSTGANIYIKFTTNESTTAQGWTINYEGIADPDVTIDYDYDESGNRTERTITMSSSSAKSSSLTQEQKVYKEYVGDKNLLIYPNPTQGELTIELKGYEQEDVITLSLYSLTGNLLVKKIQPSSSGTLDLTTYSNGTYILKVMIGNKTSKWKIIKK